eukprot:266418-Chlamydomonas_euryale.AAC.1
MGQHTHRWRHRRSAAGRSANHSHPRGSSGPRWRPSQKNGWRRRPPIEPLKTCRAGPGEGLKCGTWRVEGRGEGK